MTFSLAEVCAMLLPLVGAVAGVFWRLWALQVASGAATIKAQADAHAAAIAAQGESHRVAMSQIHGRLDEKREQLDAQEKRIRDLENNGGIAVQRMSEELKALGSLVRHLSEQVAILLDRQMRAKEFGNLKTNPGAD